MRKRIARQEPSTDKTPFKYGDLAHLAHLIPDDLSLPQEVLDDFDQAIEKLERMLTDAPENNEDSKG